MSVSAHLLQFDYVFQQMTVRHLNINEYRSKQGGSSAFYTQTPSEAPTMLIMFKSCLRVVSLYICL
jgi:hypothetical protein